MGKRAEGIKVFAAKPDNQSSFSSTHTVGEEVTSACRPLNSTRMLRHVGPLPRGKNN